MTLTTYRCRQCGCLNEVETGRAEIGEGTRSARNKKRLNLNELEIGKILFESEEPLHVRQAQAQLYTKGVKRKRRREEIPAGSWNYHDVQSILSVLAGAKIATMTKTKEFFDEHGYGAKPIPCYYMTSKQRTRFERILTRQGVMANRTPPS